MRYCLIFIFLFTQAQEQSNLMIDSFQTFKSYESTKYDQVLRPQFHFSSKKNWINDPNGLVYYKGEYHMFFQHNPKSINWGNMTWGHAISSDMIKWIQLPHAILPYGNGTIFSGTAVVDNTNSLGKNTEKEKAIVAYFTHAQKNEDPFYQSGAYSIDRGRSFNLIDQGKPLVPNQGFSDRKGRRKERDPKVFWHEPSKKWVMVLWVSKADRKNKKDIGKVRFFYSNDLKNWEFLSDFDRHWVYECMDLVKLSVDGNSQNKKWLIYDASFDYEVGVFDGKSMITNKSKHLGDLGKNYYAAQTFNNSPDGRTVIIGWMRTGKKSLFVDNNMPFNQQMSFPCTMELKTTPDGIRLFRWPIKEIESLYHSTNLYRKNKLSTINKKLAKNRYELIDLYGSFNPKKVNNFEINIRGQILSYQKGKFYFENTELPSLNRSVKSFRVLLDRTSIEIFIDEGYSVSTNYAISDHSNKTIKLIGNEKVIFNLFRVSSLNSIWQ